MKKKVLKRVISVSLATVMAVSFTACGSQGKGGVKAKARQWISRWTRLNWGKTTRILRRI